MMQKKMGRTFSIIFLSRFHCKLMIIFLSLLAAIFSLTMPYYQKIFINTLQHNSSFFHSGLLKIIIYLLLFAALSQVASFLNKILSYKEASNTQKDLSLLTYEKALYLNHSGQRHSTIGKSVSIFAADVLSASAWIDEVLINLSAYILPIILAPFAIFLIANLNPLPIITALIIILLINGYMAIRQSGYYASMKKLSAERVGLVNEYIQNIRTVRMLGWTQNADDIITNARKKETKNRLSMVTNGNIVNSISYTAPFIINLIAVFLLIQSSSKVLTVGEIFSVLWIFGVVLGRPLRMLPMLIVTMTDCYTSTKRIEKFLNLEEEPRDNFENILQKSNSTMGISIKNMNLHIEKDHILKNISFDIQPGEFIAIIGSIGSGKTLLLESILKFVDTTTNSFFLIKENQPPLDCKLISPIQLRDYFSYTPQDLFIISSSLRDNVSFEYETESKQDKNILKSLELSQFNLNFERIHEGLDTEIGERGVNLSGGQKQRVNIARAHFSNRNIILLDDPLSALDVNTEKELCEEMLLKEWKDKTRILVTHRLSILYQCHRVFFMKNGCLLEQGSFVELQERSEEVRNYISSLQKQDKNTK